MGEIGINREKLLYELRHWEILAIIKGYRNRAHTIWETTRWQTFYIAKILGCKDMGDIPAEWYPFPWEPENQKNIPDDKTIEEMRAKYAIK